MMQTPDWEKRFRTGLQHQAERAETTPEMQQRLVRNVLAAGRMAESGTGPAGTGADSAVSNSASTPFMDQRSWLQRLHDFWHGETEISVRALVSGTGVVAVAVVLIVFTALQSVPDLTYTEPLWEVTYVTESWNSGF